MLGKLLVICGLLLGTWGTLALADVPVVDYSSEVGTGNSSASSASAEASSSKQESIKEVDAGTFSGSGSGSSSSSDSSSNSDSSFSSSNVESSNKPIDQRVGRLEQQVDNINKQNLASKIDDLQERLQRLDGKVEEQAHQVEQLNTNVKNFYQDLDKRIGESKSSGSKVKAENNIVPKSNQQGDSSKVESKAAAVDGVENVTAISSASNNLNASAAAADTHTSAVSKPKNRVSTDTASLKEQQSYQTAIDLLPDKKYAESATKLRSYIHNYPNGVYIANAHYWLGEIYFLQKSFPGALVEFKIVVDKYATSKKVGDALLKVALIHESQGKHEQAVNEFKQVKKRFPNTSAAQLAAQQLQQ
jgi:tol-pal system protein YbgF